MTNMISLSFMATSSKTLLLLLPLLIVGSGCSSPLIPVPVLDPVTGATNSFTVNSNLVEILDYVAAVNKSAVPSPWNVGLGAALAGVAAAAGAYAAAKKAVGNGGSK